MLNVEELFKRRTNISEYIKNIEEPLYRKEFESRYKNYVPPSKIVEEIRKIQKKKYLICFSGPWCKDCKVHVPVLIKLLEKAANPNIKAITLNVKDSRELANKFNVTHIPTIIVFDENHIELGRIVEHPSKFKTLEEELLHILK